MKSAFVGAGVVVTMLVASAAYADNTAAAMSPSNLAVNGGFSAGNASFSSDYVYADPSMPGYSQIPETQYEVTTNISLVRPNLDWGAYNGPQSGEMFMVVNGATSLNADSTVRNFWGEVVNLTPNTNYDVTFDVANLFQVSPATVALTLNGALQGSTYDTGVNGVQGDWTTQGFVFNSGAGGSTKIGLGDLNLAAYGNDFAIGNISISAAVPEPSMWAMMIIGVAMIGFAGRRRRESVAVAA